MTGLNPKTDSILSIACFITDSKLNLLEPDGFEAIIRHQQARLDAMDEWCTRTHGTSGLRNAVLESQTSAEEAARDLLTYIKGLVPETGRALLAGNSVHVDKTFLMEGPWVTVLEYLHYRILDVSAIKEGVRRWCSDEILENFPPDLKKGKHEARADVLESIDEAKYYMGLFGRIPLS
jgi:oligoribonuclease (3'-5' exoribonuclease)